MLFDKLDRDNMQHDGIRPMLKLAWPDLKDEDEIVMVMSNPWQTPEDPPQIVELKSYDFPPTSERYGVKFTAALYRPALSDHSYILLLQTPNPNVIGSSLTIYQNPSVG